MTKISIAFLAALSLAGFGCHKEKTKDKANAGEAIAKLLALKDKMCACKDKACSEKVSAELTDWGQVQEKAAGDKAAPPGDEDDKKIEEIKDEISECLLKLEFPGGSGSAGAAGAAGAATGAGGTTGSGNPAAGAADGSAAAGATPTGGPAGGSAAAGSAH